MFPFGLRTERYEEEVAKLKSKLFMHTVGHFTTGLRTCTPLRTREKQLLKQQLLKQQLLTQRYSDCSSLVIRNATMGSNRRNQADFDEMVLLTGGTKTTVEALPVGLAEGRRVYR